MSRIHVLFFATLRDRAGVRKVDVDVPERLTVRDLKVRVSQDYPNLEQLLQSAVVAVNREFAAEDMVLPADAEVAFFPPVSGG